MYKVQNENSFLRFGYYLIAKYSFFKLCQYDCRLLLYNTAQSWYTNTTLFSMMMYFHSTFTEQPISANNKKANWRSNSFLLCLHKPSNEMTSFSPSNKQFRKLYSNLNLVVFSLDLNCYKQSTNEFIFAQMTCHIRFGKIWILHNMHNS